MKKYEQFLVQVASSSEEFSSAEAILARFYSLKQTKTDLIRKLGEETSVQEAERMRGGGVIH